MDVTVDVRVAKDVQEAVVETVVVVVMGAVEAV